MNHHQILIIGGGTAGIMTAAQLIRKDKKLDIAIIEPSDKHYYQPAWTLVGAGTFDYQKTIRKEADYIPNGVKWIRDKVSSIKPESNTLETAASGTFSYDYLVVAPGLVMDPGAMPGLQDSLDKGVVCSNYTDPEHTWDVLSKFKGGNAVFTQASTPLKCGGAPQKIMYLAEDYFRKNNLRAKSKVIYATPGTVIFGVKEFAATLSDIIEKRDIVFNPFLSPVQIDSKNNKIYFSSIKPEYYDDHKEDLDRSGAILNTDGQIEMHFDMLHLAPPQAPPQCIRDSGLVVMEGPNKGWVEVDIHTLRHQKFANVFALGDVAALPTAKTGAAIRKQAPVVVANIISLIKSGQISNESYSGYSSCPIVTAYGKMVLAEFKYDNIRDSDPLITRFVDTTKEQYSMWLLKKYLLPYLYWNQMLRGRM
jgi:sulfide:quinone oxidoreductase